MKEYLNILKAVKDNGQWQENRTGIRTKMIPTTIFEYNLQEGFPLLTTKKMAIKSCIGELLGFLRGVTSAKDFRELGCKFWDENANKTQSWLDNPYRKGEDDLGLLAYSTAWTACPNGINPDEPIHQVNELIKTLTTDPQSRRMVVSAWHPELFIRSALPPCHMAWGIVVSQSDQTLNLWWMQRSVDTFLGLPMNIASYAFLTHMLAKISGYKVGKLTGFLNDVHIYENHMDQVNEQLSRTPYYAPDLFLYYDKERVGLDISKFESSDFSFNNTYECYPAIKAPMAI